MDETHELRHFSECKSEETGSMINIVANGDYAFSKQKSWCSKICALVVNVITLVVLVLTVVLCFVRHRKDSERMDKIETNIAEMIGRLNNTQASPAYQKGETSSTEQKNLSLEVAKVNMMILDFHNISVINNIAIIKTVNARLEETEQQVARNISEIHDKFKNLTAEVKGNQSYIAQKGNNSRMLAAATGFTLIGKLGVTTAYSSVYLTTPELYPTNMRSMSLGVCAFMETVGAMIAPFSRNVSSKIKWLPACVYASQCLITVVLFAFVPETNGVELPTTIEELREWYRASKFELKFGNNKHAPKKQLKCSNGGQTSIID